VKVLPAPGALSTQITPRWSSTIRFESASPRPEPPYLQRDRVERPASCEALIGELDATIADITRRVMSRM
jgi:hypothetical protein